MFVLSYTLIVLSSISKSKSAILHCNGVYLHENVLLFLKCHFANWWSEKMVAYFHWVYNMRIQWHKQMIRAHVRRGFFWPRQARWTNSIIFAVSGKKGNWSTAKAIPCCRKSPQWLCRNICVFLHKALIFPVLVWKTNISDVPFTIVTFETFLVGYII